MIANNVGAIFMAEMQKNNRDLRLEPSLASGAIHKLAQCLVDCFHFQLHLKTSILAYNKLNI